MDGIWAVLLMREGGVSSGYWSLSWSIVSRLNKFTANKSMCRAWRGEDEYEEVVNHSGY